MTYSHIRKPGLTAAAAQIVQPLLRRLSMSPLGTIRILRCQGAGPIAVHNDSQGRVEAKLVGRWRRSTGELTMHTWRIVAFQSFGLPSGSHFCATTTTIVTLSRGLRRPDRRDSDMALSRRSERKASSRRQVRTGPPERLNSRHSRAQTQWAVEPSAPEGPPAAQPCDGTPD